MRQSSHHRNRQHGQAFIEGVLTMLVYLTFVLATMELAQTMFLFQTFSDRARHAIRMTSVQPYDSSTSEATLQNWVLYDQATVPSDADPDQGYLGLRRSSVHLIPSIANPRSDNDRLTVQVTNYSVSLMSFALVGRNNSFTGRPISYSHPYELPVN